MVKSDSIKELAVALARAQNMMAPAKKGSKNPYYNSFYADLNAVVNAIREPLAVNGLAYTQIPSVDDEGMVEVETVLMHASGEYIGGTLSMKPTKQDPQGIGSCITYARRYGLQAIVGLPAEDDDGNAGSGRTPDKKFDKVVAETQSLSQGAVLAFKMKERVRDSKAIPDINDCIKLFEGKSKDSSDELFGAKKRVSADEVLAVKAVIEERMAAITAALNSDLT
jgi:hypothetical protein